MKPKLLIRLSAGCLLFFALGHSIGHTTRHNIDDPKAQEVLKMMADTKFDLFGQMRTYDDTYTGMSLNLIFTLLAFVVVLWIISSVVETNQTLVMKLLLPIALCVAGFTITGFLFFFPVPAVTCLIACILQLWAAMKLRSSGN